MFKRGYQMQGIRTIYDSLWQKSIQTIIRFKNPINDNHLLIDCLNKYRNCDFGISEIGKIEFVCNDWYMTNSKVSVIKSFDL